jgi:mitogen-activated protein kinase kinase 1 interacting protein 1
MEDIRKLLSSYLQKVEGLLGIVLSDRDGVPILRATLAECPDSTARPGFLSAHPSGCEQASKMGMGGNATIVAIYGNYQIVHVLHANIVIILKANSGTLLGDIRGTGERLKPLVEDISAAVLEQ